MKPVLFVLSGAPGIGKTNLAMRLVDAWRHVEADHFFCKADGTYEFNAADLGTAHAWCRAQVEHLVKDGTRKDVAVANTSTTEKEREPYYSIARRYDYDAVLIVMTSPTLSSDDLFDRNRHGVPLATIEKMMDRLSGVDAYRPAVVSAT